MKCPKCKISRGEALNTQHINQIISRVRRCKNKECKHLWTTIEFIKDKFSHSGYIKKAREQAGDDGLYLFNFNDDKQ